MTNPLTTLRKLIVDTHDADELRTLCFDLGVKYDALPGEGTPATPAPRRGSGAGEARELILYLGRRRQLARLLAAVGQGRPEAFAQAGLRADPAAVQALEAALPAWEAAELGAEADKLRQGLANLADLAVQGLPVAEAQTKAQERLAALEARLEQLDVPATFQAKVEGSGAVAQGEGAVAAGEGGAAVAGGVGGDVMVGGEHRHYHGPPGTDPDALRQRYLVQLYRYCNALPLAALGGEECVDEDVTLDKVYIDLDTQTRVPLSDEEKEQRKERARFGEREDTRPLTALEAAAQDPRLVLLGDPGSGKSTFVRQLLAWLAAHDLDQAKQAPPEEMGALLPILVTLRDLTPKLQELDLEGLPAERQRTDLAHLVRDRVLADLERLDAVGFADGLQEAFAGGRCLLVFDGLDEVPQGLRRWVRRAIQAVISCYGPARIIVTCRIRSYVDRATLPNFATHTLAPFDEDKVRGFAAAWYRAQQDLGRVDAVQAGAKADDLARAALTTDLRELSSNPMLLTTMAIIHQQEIGLPKERVRLYNLAVEILLSRWHKRKLGQAARTLPADLLDLLGDERKLRQIIEQLAYRAHQQGQDKEDAADLSRGEALTLLEMPAYLGDTGLAARFLDYVDHRAGLLVGRGGGEGYPTLYSFPHRTFQEYLAGCHIVSQRDVSREMWRRVREGDYWYLAAQLGAEELLYNRRNDYVLLDVAYRLCPAAEPDEGYGWRATLWSGQMAALLGRLFVMDDDDTPDGGQAYLEKLLGRLVGLIEGNHLSVPERVDAGLVLARLGDPRPGVGLGPDGLPDVVWCEVPAGKFTMGGDDYDAEKPPHQVALPAYRIAKYPVTNAQFGAFVEAGGYGMTELWPEATQAGRWQDGKVKMWQDDEPRDRPYDYGTPFNLPNHPVVGVSWYEALAFCRWLTGAWLESGVIDSDDVVCLPTEAEWEKAVRGTDGRAYPWGEEPDPGRANYDDTGIGTTSAVGCFPDGASPYDALDMSGNVWEWTSSLDKSYPYNPEDGRENPESWGSRVIRGGAFDGNQDNVRCAYRFRYTPTYGNDYIGFRLVVAPGQPL